MKWKGYIFSAIVSIAIISCSAPERRVDFELEYSEVRDQASTQEEIAPGLRVFFMHAFESQITVRFSFEKNNRVESRECVATLQKDDGTTYQQSFTITKRWLRLAYVDDKTHMNWMHDDLISLNIDGHLYELYDKKCVQRILRKLYNASEDKKVTLI